MGILQITAATLAVVGTTLAAPTAPAADIKWAEATGGSINFKFAIPDSAASGKPFDILLSMTAPKAVGWGAIAWGGQMANNPLTIGWANGNSAMASSRMATGHTYPTPYTGATLTTLPSSTSNATHWKLDVLCTGCSSWSGGKGLDPASASTFAYASSGTAPTEPANKDSKFGIHNAKGKFSGNLAAGKNADFDSLVKAAMSAKAAKL